MSYRQQAEHLELGHQICQFWFHCWINKALRELKKTLLEEWQGVLEEIKQLITDLPSDRYKRLYTHWKQTGVRLDCK